MHIIPGFLSYALRLKKELSIDDTTQKGVFYTAHAEAEETVQYQSCNTKRRFLSKVLSETEETVEHRSYNAKERVVSKVGAEAEETVNRR